MESDHENFKTSTVRLSLTLYQYENMLLHYRHFYGDHCNQ